MMKHVLKKALLALMVGVGMIGAIGLNGAWAQSNNNEKVQVRISGLFTWGEFIEVHSAQEFCDAITGWSSTIIYLGQGKVIGNNVYCLHRDKQLLTDNWVMQSARCQKGGRFNAQRFGCYEEKKECPEGTKADSDGYCMSEKKCPEGKEKDGDECLDECELAEKHGTPLPEGCPDCSKDFPLDPGGNPAAGAVACKGTRMKSCTNLSASFWSKHAGDSALDCLIKHEEEHVNDSNITCGEDGWAIIADPVVRFNAEMNAHKNQAQCLRDAQDGCGWNPVCIAELWNMAQIHDIMGITYRNWRDAAAKKQ